MKLISLLLSFLLLTVQPAQAVVMVNFGQSSESFSSLWSENWSGTDGDWTETLGDPDTSYTATITGYTEDLYLGAKAASADQELYRVFSMTTAGAIANFRFKLKCADLPTSTGSRNIAILKTGTSAPRAHFYMAYSSGVKFTTTAFGGSTSTVTTSTLSTNTEYWVHGRYQKGSGSNAKASISFGPTWPVPTSSDAAYTESTNGTATADATYFYLGGDNYNIATSSYNCEIGTVEYWETSTW